MKFVLGLGILCLTALVVSAGKSQKKNDYQPELNEDVDFRSESKEHNMKKYGNDHKHHHHHHHQKHHTPLDKINYKNFGKRQEQEKKQKHVPKNAPHEVPVHEAELQADVKINKKHLKDQHMRHEQEDLHLQDLSFVEREMPETAHPGKSPHQYQRGHHKTNQHFVHHKKASKQEKDVQVEEKLFDDQVPKENEPKASPPVLEDSFEALNEDTETKKHSKKAPKHKKAYEKAKKDKKNKKDKKEKKQKDKKEKQKW